MLRATTDTTIRLKGPQSDIDAVPQISVEKYRATDEPVNAPNDPPALIIPKYFLASWLWKKLIIDTQKIETTKNE